MKRLPGISFLALCLSILPVNAVELVEDGQARAMVVLPDTPSPVARKAEAIFSAQVERISGAKLKRVLESQLSEFSSIRTSLQGAR